MKPVSVARHVQMFIVDAAAETPTTVEFNWPAHHVAIATDEDIMVGYNSDTIPAETYSLYKSGECWPKDLLCTKVTVQAVSATAEVRIEVMADSIPNS